MTPEEATKPSLDQGEHRVRTFQADSLLVALVANSNLFLFSVWQLWILQWWFHGNLRVLDLEWDAREWKFFEFCLESVCMCSVSLHTCRAVDHSSPPLSLSPCFHTLFFFPYPQTQGFIAGCDLLHSLVLRRESFPTQGGGSAVGHRVDGISALSPADRGGLSWNALTWSDTHWCLLGDENTRSASRKERSSVSAAAPRTSLRSTARSRWPGPTDVLGLSSGSGLDQLREHDT